MTHEACAIVELLGKILGKFPRSGNFNSVLVNLLKYYSDAHGLPCLATLARFLVKKIIIAYQPLLYNLVTSNELKHKGKTVLVCNQYCNRTPVNSFFPQAFGGCFNSQCNISQIVGNS